MARYQPEFLGRLYDYLDSWRRRIAFDNEGVQLLVAAYRGEAEVVEKLLGHVDGQVASHFILLREDFLNTRRGQALEVGGSQSSESLFPSYLMDLMISWNNSSGSAAGEFVNERAHEICEWYRSVVGQQVLNTIELGRMEIDEKFGPLLAKFRNMDKQELLRSKGQILVLLKREFKIRCELLGEEQQLLSLLDSRHALLIRKFDIFAKLKWLLMEQ